MIWGERLNLGKEKNKVETTGREESSSCLFRPTLPTNPSAALWAPSEWVVEAGRERKGKLSQNLRFLYFLLPEQRGGKAGKGPKLLALPDVEVMDEKMCC